MTDPGHHYGFTATNSDNKVLISSSVKGFHHGGQATRVTYNDGFRFGTWPTTGSAPYVQAAHQGLSGRVIYKFQWNSPSGSVVYPIVFIKPGSYNAYYSMIQQSLSGSTWTFMIMQSGTTEYLPEIHVFCSPKGLNEPTGDSYGLRAWLQDGEVSFDSRLNPLSIQEGGQLKPPADPTNGTGYPVVDSSYPGSSSASWGGPTLLSWISLDHDFDSDTRKNTATISLDKPIGNYMFCASGIHQACYERYKWGFYTTYDDYFFFTISQDHKSKDKWWCLYRSGFRILSTTQFQAGWIAHSASHSYWTWHESVMFGGDGGSTAGGSAPFDSTSVNLTFDESAFLITDRYLYP
jgi:hypothetical protein